MVAVSKTGHFDAELGKQKFVEDLLVCLAVVKEFVLD